MKKYILCAFVVLQSYGYQTVPDLEKLSQSLNEYPANDYDNWMYPDYDALYTDLSGNIIKKIFLKQSRYVSAFLTDLAQLTKSRKSATAAHNFVGKLTCQPGTKIIIWSDLHSAFHSLVRDLQWLKAQNIIDDNLTITQPDYYFVFNGDSINRGPYGIASLYALISLMHANPEKVFYIRGKQERNKYWMNGVLKSELKIRTKNPHAAEELVANFFDTLPLALYVTEKKDGASFIRISHTGRDDTAIQEKTFSHELAKQSETALTFIPLDTKNIVGNGQPDIIAIIKTEDWRREARAKNGLGLLGQDQGATAWTIFSSPIQAHKELINFSYDAFGILTIKSPLQSSTITLYNQSATKKEGFHPVSSFSLQSATPISDENGINNKGAINIGSSMSLHVQGVPVMGQQTKRGMSARVNKANKEGGIHNNLIRTVVYNDDYSPRLTRTNVNRLLKKDNIDLILLPVGSPTLASYLDYIKENKLLVLFPITGGPQFRDPELAGLVHFRGTYEDEVRALVDYIYTEGAARKFAFFYQDDAYGKGPLEAAHQELKKKGITEWTDVPYQRNSVNFTKQANMIRDAQPEAIGLFATAQAAREVIRQIGIDFLTNKQLFGISFLGEESFRRYVKKHGLNVLFGAVVPNPKTSDLQIVKEYRAEMDKNGDPYDVFSLEGYIATSILLDAIKHIEPPVTKDKILKKLESYKEYKFKGLTLTFNPQRRDLARYIWLESGENKEWVQKDIKSEY